MEYTFILLIHRNMVYVSNPHKWMMIPLRYYQYQHGPNDCLIKFSINSTDTYKFEPSSTLVNSDLQWKAKYSIRLRILWSYLLFRTKQQQKHLHISNKYLFLKSFNLLLYAAWTISWKKKMLDKDAVQYPRVLFSVFVIRCLDSITHVES